MDTRRVEGGGVAVGGMKNGHALGTHSMCSNRHTAIIQSTRHSKVELGLFKHCGFKSIGR